jgi:TetR/AcrR family transcriptional repressor of nem operon
MRITQAQAQENHDRVVATAAQLFRERGFDGVAVGELMKAAGFTHGGFYNHFQSKDALAAEALDHAFRAMDDERARVSRLDQLLRAYLSDAARRAPGRSCPAAALAGDVARQPPQVRAVFEDGVERIITSLAERLPPRPDRRAAAIDLYARMAGALSLARAMPDGSPLAAEMLKTTLQACLDELEDPSRSRANT